METFELFFIWKIKTLDFIIWTQLSNNSGKPFKLCLSLHYLEFDYSFQRAIRLLKKPSNLTLFCLLWRNSMWRTQAYHKVGSKPREWLLAIMQVSGGFKYFLWAWRNLVSRHKRPAKKKKPSQEQQLCSPRSPDGWGPCSSYQFVGRSQGIKQQFHTAGNSRQQ